MAGPGWSPDHQKLVGHDRTTLAFTSWMTDLLSLTQIYNQIVYDYARQETRPMQHGHGVSGTG
jgi:hypothetical protein